MKLFISAISKLVIGLGAIATLLFAPAGTFAFPGAWRLLMLLFIPMIIMGVALLIWHRRLSLALAGRVCQL